MKAIVKNKNIIVSSKVKIAKSTFDRVIGLMFKKEMIKGDSLLIEPCNSIHTCFMNFPIDVLFLSSSNQILHIVRNMRAWRFSKIYFKSKRVLELGGGELAQEINVGDILEFENL